MSLALSRRLLGLTERQRALRLPQLMQELIDSPGKPVVVLDNVELLFDPNLRQNPIRLFQSLARNRTLIVAWTGQLEGDYLTIPGQPEFRQRKTDEFIVVI